MRGARPEAPSVAEGGQHGESGGEPAPWLSGRRRARGTGGALIGSPLLSPAAATPASSPGSHGRTDTRPHRRLPRRWP